MRTWTLLAAAATAMLSGTAASAQVVAMGDGRPTDRSGCRIFYWDQTAEAPAGQVMLHFARPEWKPDYDDAVKFDAMTKGKTFRLGKDFWTTLNTDVALVSGKQTIKPGQYFLALHRTDEGKFQLAFILADEARKKKLDAFQSEQAPVAFMVPVRDSQVKEKQAKLNILLLKKEDTPTDLTMIIRWGLWRLAVPLKVQMPSA